MKRKILVGLVGLVLLASLWGCASETPWRKATITTFELVGIGIETTRSTTESLKAQGLITDEQVKNIKNIYNKAIAVYSSAGNSLKLAGKAESAISRDKFLEEYDKLLSEFRVLVNQIVELIGKFKKVSYNDVLELVKNGGEI